jgi:hypothetical protein
MPPEAEVIDIGAGRSSLGHEVCVRRPDIRWLNVDLAYSHVDILEERLRNAPENLSHQSGNVLNLQPHGKNRFDRVFSYWLLPYIRLAGSDKLDTAMRGIFDITKPEGTISVGPRYSRVGIRDADEPSISMRKPVSDAEAWKLVEEVSEAVVIPVNQLVEGSIRSFRSLLRRKRRSQRVEA